jgi:LuxR family transcriptional regulator, maltose regulon positive regulatory protein
MHAGLRQQLTLVSAPAGFGKSTLVSMWVAELGTRTAWLSLDQEDNDPTRFWSAVRASFHAGATLALGPGGAHEEGLTELINGIAAAADPLVLVLDDYHLITNPTIHQQLAWLLAHQPPNLKLIIVTRADPPLPLIRLRAHDQLHDIRVADLRLSVEEAHAFFQQVMELPLTPQDVQALTQRTEGWLAGLQLAALSLQQHPDPQSFIAQFTGRQQYIMEYLTEEVLAQLPEELYAFLLATSPLDQLTAPLCDAVLETDGSQALLLRLYAGNLFLLALDASQTWFRYHHLFAELLRARLVQTRGREAAAACLRRAAAWCEAQHMPEQAIRYALASGDEARAVRLIEGHWHHIAHRGELTTLAGWLDGLPPATADASAPLGVARCWLHYLTGQIQAVAPQLERARRAWAARIVQGPPAEASWLVVPPLLEVVAAIVALHEQRPQDSLGHAERALLLIPAGTDAAGAAVLRGTANYQAARAQTALGDYRAAAATLTAVLDDLLAGGNTLGAANTLADLADLWERLGRTWDAAALCERVVASLERRAEADLPVASLVYSTAAMVHVRAGNATRAHAYLGRAEAVGRGGSQRALKLAAQVHDLLARGQPLPEALSERELEVLALMGKGHSNQQIAEELAIALSTVKKHAGNILGKLGVTSRTQAVLRAQALGLIATVD